MLATYLSEWWSRSEEELQAASAAGDTSAAFRLSLIHLDRGEREAARRLWVGILESDAADDLVVAAAAINLVWQAKDNEARSDSKELIAAAAQTIESELL